MGILNVTPDSFSDGGNYVTLSAAIACAKQLVADGADILDIGGESTRPGSQSVSVDEELRRVIPVIKALVQEVSVPLSIPLSIDTTKPDVAQRALDAGASIVNSITGLQNPEFVRVIAQYKVPVVVMHMQGTPTTMQQQPHYNNVVKEVYDFFKQQLVIARKNNIKHIILDPGIGFGKTLEHNLTLLKHISTFTALRKPLLLGTSRKSFIGKILDTDVCQRLEGTLASNCWAVFHGVHILRVHDVKEHKRALEILAQIQVA